MEQVEDGNNFGDSIKLIKKEELKQVLLNSTNILETLQQFEEAHKFRTTSIVPNNNNTSASSSSFAGLEHRLKFADDAGLPRGEVYRSLTQYLRDRLCTRIDAWNSETKIRVLRLSLPYVEVDELSAVPLKLLDTYEVDLPKDVCEAIMKLPTDVLFNKIPSTVRQKSWETFPAKFEECLRGEINDYVKRYVKHYEMYTQLSRVRKLNCLSKMVNFIGSSPILYDACTNMIRAMYKESNASPALCSLQSDLLLRMNDVANNMPPTQKQSDLFRARVASEPCRGLVLNLEFLQKNFGRDLKRDAGVMENLRVAVKEICAEVAAISAPPAQATPSDPRVNRKDKILSKISLDEFLLEIIATVEKVDGAKWFKHPAVKDQSKQFKEDYERMIPKQEWMDLSTMKRKKYERIGEFEADVARILANCKRYNGETAELYRTALAVFGPESVCKREIEKARYFYETQQLSPRTPLKAVDACMILGDQNARNLLLKLLFEALHFEVGEQKQVPRESELATNLCWLLSLGDADFLQYLLQRTVETNQDNLLFANPAQTGFVRRAACDFVWLGECFRVRDGDLVEGDEVFRSALECVTNADAADAGLCKELLAGVTLTKLRTFPEAYGFAQREQVESFLVQLLGALDLQSDRSLARTVVKFLDRNRSPLVRVRSYLVVSVLLPLIARAGSDGETVVAHEIFLQLVGGEATMHTFSAEENKHSIHYDTVCEWVATALRGVSLEFYTGNAQFLARCCMGYEKLLSFNSVFEKLRVQLNLPRADVVEESYKRMRVTSLASPAHAMSPSLSPDYLQRDNSTSPSPGYKYSPKY